MDSWPASPMHQTHLTYIHVFLLAYKYPPSDHMCMYCICSCDQNVCGADYSDYSLVCAHIMQTTGVFIMCKIQVLSCSVKRSIVTWVFYMFQLQPI